MFYNTAKEWNKLDINIKFQWVNKIKDAVFILAYGSKQDFIFTKSFFPNTLDLNMVYMYQNAFQPDFVSYLNKIFFYKLRHILSLWHKFTAQKDGAIL